MIERIDTATRMSKIVKHNGTVYLCGQVGAGDTAVQGDMLLPANVEFSGTPAALSPEAPLERRVGGAVPPAPTFGGTET